jgi:hypothetical protein
MHHMLEVRRGIYPLSQGYVKQESDHFTIKSLGKPSQGIYRRGPFCKQVQDS